MNMRCTVVAAFAALALGPIAGCSPANNTGDTVATDAMDTVMREAGPSTCTTSATCNDNIPCTDEVCVGGRCIHTPNAMRCTSGACDPRTGCSSGATCGRDAECNDLDPCTTNERCDMTSHVCVWDILDRDNDGHPPVQCGGQDCDDARPDATPGGTERCNGLDDDCDGMADDPPAGVDCGRNSFCMAGRCQCRTGFPLQCADGCVEPMTDPVDCGMCGQPCGMMASCMAGTCVCASGTATFCRFGCTDLMTDALNCGMCATRCAMSERCVAGVCVPR